MPSNNNIYNLDWNKLVRWLTPPALRLPNMLALLKSMVMPVNDMHSRFTYYRNNALYRLAITPQVCYLEKALNDRYDVIARRIYITDGVELFGIPFFLKSENKPVVFSRKSEGNEQVLYTKAETAYFSADFVINVPITVAFDINELTAFTNGYKLASKTFKVRIV